MQYSKAVTRNSTALIAIFLLALVIISFTNLGNVSENITFKKQNEIFKNIFVQKILIPNDNNIFFLETSCIVNGNIPDGLHLNSRQACAIYSTAKINPSRPVILYHSCPLHPNFYERLNEGSKHLLKLPNVFILNLKYDDILRGSLVENIIDDIKFSRYPVEHGADVLRLALLHRFGGAYMDLDFISIKPLDSLPKNVLSPESKFELSNGFFQFEHKGKGNEFLKDMLIGLSKHFKKNSWSGNGPVLVGNNFVKFCNIPKVVSSSIIEMRSTKVLVTMFNGVMLLLLFGILVTVITHDNKISSLNVQKVLVPNNNNIFFIETSCINKSKIPDGLHLNSRQACAIYSTAKMNPSRPVILYHSCPLHPNFYERSSEGNKHLLKLPNVFVLHLKYEDILRGSLVESIIDDIKSSQYSVEHASDALRVVLLYKYGGTYMDLDFISIRSLDSLPKNVLSPQAPTELCNAFLKFDFEGKGNEFLRGILNNLSKNYMKDSWIENGQVLIEKEFFHICSVAEDVPFTQVQSNQCEISVCNITTFHPIYYAYWKKIFSPSHTNFVMNQLNNSIAVHFWNHLSKNEKIKIGENTAYEILARQYCPDILESARDSF